MISPWILLGSILCTAFLSLLAGLLSKKKIYYLFFGILLILGFIHIQLLIRQSGEMSLSVEAFYILTIGSALFLILVLYRNLNELSSVFGHLTVKDDHQEKEVTNENREYISLKSKALIPLGDIQFIKSDGPYSELFLVTKSKPEVDRNSLKDLLGSLPDNFIRVNKSTIVNRHYIKAIEDDHISLHSGQRIQYSDLYKLAI